MPAKTVPVFIVLGFLDSGKTAFIKDTLVSDYFNDGSKTLILACEEGEEEFDEQTLSRANACAEFIDSQEAFTPAAIEALATLHKPDRIFIEYNGMWPMPLLSQTLEQARWEIAQIITIACGDGYDLYLQNMRSLAIEMFKVSDLLIFNRCLTATPTAQYRRIARAANPRCQVAFEPADGVELSEAEQLPYNLSADIVDIDDGDYAIFHMDAQENAERYNGRVFHFKAQFAKPRWGVKSAFIPGRFAMVCCANDVQFVGYMAQCDPYMVKNFRNRDWVELTAQLKYEKRSEYKGVGPVWYVQTIKACEKPAEEVCYF